MTIGNEPYGVVEFQIAPYTDASTGTAGTWVSAPKRKTFTVTPSTNVVTNTYNDGPGSSVTSLTGATLTGTLAGVPLAFIAAALGLTLTLSGTGASATQSISIPKAGATPPLMAARWRQILVDENGQDQTVRVEGIRFPPALALTATESAHTNQEFSATVEGVATGLVTVTQRTTAAAFT
jgi:hypothetical protein